MISHTTPRSTCISFPLINNMIQIGRFDSWKNGIMSSRKNFLSFTWPSNIQMTHYSNFILTDSIKDLNSPQEGFLRCRERDPHVGIPFGEDAARDNKKIIFNGFFNKGLSVCSRNFREDI